MIVNMVYNKKYQKNKNNKITINMNYIYYLRDIIAFPPGFNTLLTSLKISNGLVK